MPDFLRGSSILTGRLLSLFMNAQLTHPAVTKSFSIFLFKVNSENHRAMREIFYFISIVDFEQRNANRGIFSHIHSWLNISC